MSTVVIIVLAVLVALIALFALKKKPAQLPEAPPAKKLPSSQASQKAVSQATTSVAPASTSKSTKTREPQSGSTDESPAVLKKDRKAADPKAPVRSTPPPARSETEEPVPSAALLEDDITVEDSDRPPPPVHKKKIEAHTDLQAMRRGLAKSRESSGFFGRLFSLFSGKREITRDVAEQIEEILLTSDVGVQTTETLLERVRDGLGRGDLVDGERVWAGLRREATRILSLDGAAGPLELKAKPTVVLMVGVNGSGKTTTIGKLATRLKASGLNCVLAAGDTFRAAAVQQLVIWGDRVGCEVVKGKEGADPGSVVFDAIKRAQELHADVVLADTAGRLHTKSNLMAEMKKIAKTADKAMPGAPHEVLLVIDATNGQNALAQAKEFKEALDLTGIVLTKLDGTAKGGMVLGICDNLALPVRFIGLGERPNDLHDFVAEAFVEALLGNDAVAEKTV